MKRREFMRGCIAAAFAPLMGRLPLSASESVAVPAVTPFYGGWSTATTTSTASNVTFKVVGDTSALDAAFARAAERARRIGETVSWDKRTGARLVNGEREYVRGLA